MAYFVFENRRVYYEEYGKGKPLVVLNGIMMSCTSWKEFIEPFSANNRLILMDFLDQGKSDHLDGMEYDHSIQVELVKALFDFLALDQACLMGISYGSEVAQEFTLKYQERVERLLLFNATAATGPWLGDIGDAWNLATYSPDAYYLTTIPVIYSPKFYKEKNEWLNNRRKVLNPVFSNKDFIEGMIRLTNSSRNYDIRDQLHKITVPTLVVSCEQDYLTPVEEQEFIVSKIPNSHHVVLPGCGHASMYEQPLLYASLVVGFCNVSKTEYKIS